MRKTGLHGYVYDFSVDYDAIAVDDILDIDNYLMIILLFYCFEVDFAQNWYKLLGNLFWRRELFTYVSRKEWYQ